MLRLVHRANGRLAGVIARLFIIMIGAVGYLYFSGSQSVQPAHSQTSATQSQQNTIRLWTADVEYVGSSDSSSYKSGFWESDYTNIQSPLVYCTFVLERTTVKIQVQIIKCVGPLEWDQRVFETAATKYVNSILSKVTGEGEQYEEKPKNYDNLNRPGLQRIRDRTDVSAVLIE